MIFENIISGISFDTSTLYISFVIIISAFAAVLLSTAMQKAFSKRNFPFLKTLFSLSTLFSVVSALFFGAAAVSISKNPDKKAAAKSAAFSWIFITFTGFILIAVIYPILPASAVLISGTVFISVSAVNILPIPGFLCFSFLEYVFPEELSEKAKKLEKYSVFFIIFTLMLAERSGILNIITGLYS